MTKTIELSRKYELPGIITFDKIELREPTYSDIFMTGIGSPIEAQPAGNGKAVIMRYPDVVDRYAQRLLISPGYEHIGRLGIADALRLEQAICDFFIPPASTTSPTLPTSSSSDSDGAPSTSEE